MKRLHAGLLLALVTGASGCASYGHTSWLAMGKDKQAEVAPVPLPTKYDVPADVPHASANESLDPEALKAQRAAAKALHHSGASGGSGASCH